MRLRRMRRTADLKEMFNGIVQYGDKILKQVENFKNNARQLKTTIEQYEADQSNDNARAVKKIIVDLINGNNESFGLSELPEVEGYDSVFDSINKEYRNLKVRKGQNTDLAKEIEPGKKFLANVINNIINSKIDEALDAFVEALKNQYGAEYANGWNPLRLAIFDLTDDEISILNRARQILEGNNNKVKEEFSKFTDQYDSQLQRNFSDFQYYLKSFKNLYGGKTPSNEEKGPYENVVKAMDEVANQMQLVEDQILDIDEGLQNAASTEKSEGETTTPSAS